LTILEKEELVFHQERRGATGRPAIVYFLHENALDTFPKVYVEFALDLLHELETELGTETTVHILDRVGVKIADRIIAEMNEQYKIDFRALPLNKKVGYVLRLFDYYGKYPGSYFTRALWTTCEQGTVFTRRRQLLSISN
jgi:predicted ArsR family transcriptional regulator